MKKTIIIGVILIIVALAVFFTFKYGILPAYKSGTSTQQQEPNTPPLEKPKIVLPKVLYNLAGSIQEIGQNSVVLDASIPQIDESGQPIIKKEIRKIITTLTTKFTRLTFVAQAGSTSRTPQETPIAFGDLKKGDYVEAVSNEDIWDKQEFEATLIRVLQKNF